MLKMEQKSIRKYVLNVYISDFGFKLNLKLVVEYDDEEWHSLYKQLCMVLCW